MSFCRSSCSVLLTMARISPLGADEIGAPARMDLWMISAGLPDFMALRPASAASLRASAGFISLWAPYHCPCSEARGTCTRCTRGCGAQLRQLGAPRLAGCDGFVWFLG